MPVGASASASASGAAAAPPPPPPYVDRPRVGALVDRRAESGSGSKPLAQASAVRRHGGPRRAVLPPRNTGRTSRRTTSRRTDKPAHARAWGPERRRAREGSVIHRRAWPPVTRIRLLLCRRREHVGPSVGLSSTSRHGQAGGPSWLSGIGGHREKLKRRQPGRSRRCTGVSALARPSCGPGEANSRPFRGSDSDPNGPDPDGGSVSRTGLP